MESNDDSLNRRGSLSISALLNDDTVNPVVQRNSFSSSDGRSSSTSPPLSNKEVNAQSSERGHIVKAKRKRISQEQCRRLTEVFEQTDTPSSEMREKLAGELLMTKREVQVWFQNRRAKVSRSKNLVHSRRRSSIIPLQRTTTIRQSSLTEPYAPQHHTPVIKQQNLPSHCSPQNPSPIDLLASAAEYVKRSQN